MKSYCSNEIILTIHVTQLITHISISTYFLKIYLDLIHTKNDTQSQYT